jgi:alkylation response protein AidB-like acyl-CoA dehydrogenase
MVQRALKLKREFQQLVALVEEQKKIGISFAEDPIIESRLVDMYTKCEKLTALSYRIIGHLDKGIPLGALPAISKLSWSETHQELLNLAVDILGEESLVGGEQNHWMQRFLFSRAETIYAGTTEIQKNIIAKSLGLPSSKGGA